MADAIHEHALLLEVVELHPTHLTLRELLRRMGADPAGAFDQVDPWRRAARELWRDGLVRLEGPVVVPTGAALRFYELFEL
jgi:hypothetical protein